MITEVQCAKDVLNQSLVDLQLPQIPGLGTFTIGRLAGADLEVLGGQADGALDAEVLGFGAVYELSAHLLDGLDILAGEGDADLVDFLQRNLLVKHFPQQQKGRMSHTGPSPKSLSPPFWYPDIFAVVMGFSGHDARVLVT
jgi:hypothetical protein